MSEQPTLRDWSDLTAEEQTQVRTEYGYHLDSLPLTCSLETKIERFRSWLREEKAIGYDE